MNAVVVATFLLAAGAAHAADPAGITSDHRARDSESAWIEQKTTASDGAAGTWFGTSASIDGPTAAVGGMGDAVFRGAVYILTRNDGSWSETQKLVADDGAPGDELGYRVALEDDTLVATAFTATVNGITSQGAAYVFGNDEGTWLQTQKLVADDGALFDNFGASLALDGDLAILGANGATVGKDAAQGAAYVFVRSGTTWTQVQKLIADDGAAYDNFGFTAAVSGDTAFIGAHTAAIDGNTSQGAVYIFTLSNGTWVQSQKLLAGDGAANDAFGSSVAFDGGTLVIGATGHQGNGAAYVFEDAGGMWQETQKLTADDGAPGDYFGNNVALHENSVLIAADIKTVDGNVSQGAVYLFNAADGIWNQAHRFIASDGMTDDFFGAGLAWDGTTAIMSSPHPAIDGNSWQGAAYFYSSDTLFNDGFESDAP